MNVFKALYKKLPELKDYLDYFFEENESFMFGSNDVDSCLKGIQLVREEVFSPVDADNRASYDCSIWLAGNFSATLILEMCDPSKVTVDYLNAKNGKYSMKNTSAAKKSSICHESKQ